MVRRPGAYTMDVAVADRSAWARARVVGELVAIWAT